MKFAARFIGLFVSIIFLLVFLKPSFAQEQGQANNANIATPTYLNVFTQKVLLETLSATSCQLTGVNITHRDLGCLVPDNKTGQMRFEKNSHGALGSFTNLVAMTFNPPIHTSQYVNYLAQNFGFTKHAYAADPGSGFKSLADLGLLSIWQVFRNISYLAFILIFVVIGLAIMLRAKIDPRTVMTIQNQIPKLIIGLIMITFSFAIAGLAVDLMWVSTYTVISVISSADSNINAGTFTKELNNNPIGYANNTLVEQNNSMDWNTQSSAGLFGLSTNVAGGVQNVISRSFSASQNNGVQSTCDNPFCGIGNFLGGVVQTGIGFVNNVVNVAGDILTLNVSDLLNRTIGALISTIATTLISWVVGIIAFFVIIILIFVSLFRLWIALLKSYIGIMLDVMFAPFWIMSGMFPGAKGAGFGAWLKDLIANLAVFPATVGLFMIADLFMVHKWGNSSTIFVPPLIGPSEGFSTLAPIIGFAFIFSAPHMIESVKKAIKNMGGLDLSGADKSIGALQAAGIAGAAAFMRPLVRRAPDQYSNAGILRRGAAMVIAGGRLPTVSAINAYEDENKGTLGPIKSGRLKVAKAIHAPEKPTVPGNAGVPGAGPPKTG